MPLTENFKIFLESIRVAKYKADKLIELIVPGHEMAEASIAIVWEAFFTHLCELKDAPETLDASTLNTLAGVLQKLMSSFTHLRALDAKLREAEDGTPAAKKAAAALKATTGLTSETLREIESRLSLL